MSPRCLLFLAAVGLLEANTSKDSAGRPVVLAHETSDYEPSAPGAQLTAHYRFYDSSVFPSSCAAVWEVVRDRPRLLGVASPGVRAEWINVEGGGPSRIGAHLQYIAPGDLAVTEEITAIDEARRVLAFRTVGAPLGLHDASGKVRLVEITDAPTNCFCEVERTFALNEDLSLPLATQQKKLAQREMQNLKAFFATGGKPSHDVTLYEQEIEL